MLFSLCSSLYLISRVSVSLVRHTVYCVLCTVYCVLVLGCLGGIWTGVSLQSGLHSPC